MENVTEWDHKNVENEVKKGRELAKVLHIKLNGGIYEDAPPHCGSPRREDSDRDFKYFDSKDSSKKRKSMPMWTRQVRICPGTRVEEPLDDGYNWRKYGQRDIFGSKYPRGYYRCSHRFAQGCLATKQIQRSDKDATIFEITYRERHICTQSPNLLTQLPLQKQDSRVITENLDNKIDQSKTHDVENYGFFPTTMGNYRETNNQQGKCCELSEVTSAADANSPTGGFEFPFGKLEEFGYNFTFDEYSPFLK